MTEIAPSTNWFLSQLPGDDYRHLVLNLQPVDFEPEQVFYKAYAPTGCACFVERGLVSVVSTMEDGGTTEVALVGNEGMR